MMMKLNLMLVLLLVGFSHAVAADKPAAEATIGKETVYYATDRDFGDSDDKFETRAAFSYSNSNPYLNVYGGNLEAYYLANRFFAFGVEGGMYGSSLRFSAKQIENELKRHGYSLETMSRSHLIRGVVRVTPLSSLSNVLSSSTVKMDIALTGRGGAARFGDRGWGASLGFGLEAGFRFKNGLGITSAILWDWDAIPGARWQARTGFLVGPSLRF